MIPEEVRVGNLAEDLSPEAEVAAATKARPLSEYLDRIREPLPPGEAGGVPLPEGWRCVRAAIGGASRRDLEEAYGPPGVGKGEDAARMADVRVTRAADQEGTHLPAGLHIVTGQTGGGKSALVVNLALAAAKARHPVLYVSMELDGGEIAARLLGLESGVPWYRLALRKHLSAEHLAARNAGEETFAELNVGALVNAYVPETFVPGEVAREALALWRTFGRVPLVIFDYLQLATVRSADSYRGPLREAVAQVTLELRALSRHIDGEPAWQGCPVVVLSTTARGNVTGENAAPGMNGKAPDDIRKADLETLKALPKEAGEVEATAVTAWVVALGEDDTGGTRPLALRLVKSRLGLPGQWIPFIFHGATGRLEEDTGRYASAKEKDREAADDSGNRSGRGSRGGASGGLAAAITRAEGGRA
jgi:hypothetical protein